MLDVADDGARGGCVCWACGAAAHPDARLSGAGYSRCGHCGLLFQPARTAAEVASLYNDEYFRSYAGGGRYTDEDSQRAYEARRRVAFVRRFAKGGRLLEVGSAGGHFLAEARSVGFEVRGIEPVASMAAEARRRFGIPVASGMVADLSGESSAADVVCAFHVLEHLLEPVAALRSLREAVAPSGVLILEVPNVDSAIARHAGLGWFNLQPSHHVAHYGPEVIRAVLPSTGLEVLQVTTVAAAEYVDPRKALTRNSLLGLASVVRRARIAPWVAHPYKHEFMRVVARPAVD